MSEPRVFKVWNPDECDEEDANEFRERSDYCAVMKWAQRNYYDDNYWDEVTCMVREGDSVRKWTVRAEQTVAFHPEHE